MKIYASLENDSSEGYVWLKKPGLPARSIIKIRDPQSRKTVYCEALQFEDNFLRRYNETRRYTINSPESAIVMSAWYRSGLGGLETQKEYALEITAANSCWGKVWACLHHPQIVARIAVVLALWSVALGAVGTVLGILSLWPK